MTEPLLSIPTLSALIARVNSDMVAGLGAAARVRRSLAYVAGRAIAGVSHGMYGALQRAVQELHPFTAESYGILFWAGVLDIQRGAAVASVVTATLEGTPSTVVPAGTQATRADGVLYALASAATIGGGGTVDADWTCLAPGTDGDCTAGQILTLTSPVSGVISSVEVVETATPGEDEETLQALKLRYLERLANPPQGGATADYKAWAKEALPGVVRKVWVLGADDYGGPGTVNVRFSVTGDDPVPSGDQVDAVDAYIQARRPVTANVDVVAPSTQEWSMEIEAVALAGYDLDTVKDGIYAEIRALFLDEGEPGVDLPVSHLQAAIARTEGLDYHVLHTIESTPVDAALTHLVMSTGNIPVLADGGITWV